MSAVGSLSVDLLSGTPLSMRERVETWNVPGLDGLGAQLLGQGTASTKLVTVTLLASAALANAHIAAAEALVGTIVTVTDDSSQSFANCLVLGVLVTEKRAVVHEGSVKFRTVLSFLITRSA